jgi:hypothetical protein
VDHCNLARLRRRTTESPSSADCSTFTYRPITSGATPESRSRKARVVVGSTQQEDTEIVTDTKPTPSEAMFTPFAPCRRKQGGEFVAGGGSGLRHGPVDVAFDGADGKNESLGNGAVGQSFTD